MVFHFSGPVSRCFTRTCRDIVRDHMTTARLKSSVGCTQRMSVANAPHDRPCLSAQLTALWVSVMFFTRSP